MLIGKIIVLLTHVMIFFFAKLHMSFKLFNYNKLVL